MESLILKEPCRIRAVRRNIRTKSLRFQNK